MKEQGLAAKIRKKNNMRKLVFESQSIEEDKLKRNFKSNQANEKFVSDITEITARDGKLYLMIIQDLYNNEIVEYEIRTI
ncbi:hypothetical protein [Marinitoga litoralis]|jgi:putative transposase|uniref:hypothetical protein n=1 Tax=Marinitoga litoralis TaxID=570855 RepID=UPI003B8489C0|nr:transposase InsO family protein [Marinitoga litoralis]